MKIALKQTVSIIALSLALSSPSVSRSAPRPQKKGTEAVSVFITEHTRRTLYHSPQSPGYTCWANIWLSSDGSLTTTFTQATGAIGVWRPRAPKAVLNRMPKANQEIAGYDMTGLTLENVFLRSDDSGKTWRKIAAERFESCLNGMCGGGVAELPGGALIRDIWGQDLPFWDVPHTGMLQISKDGAKSWSAPKTLSADSRLQTWPKRIRRLRDGRVVITGATCSYDPDNWTWEAQIPRIRPCMWVSREPATEANFDAIKWEEPIYLAPDKTNAAGEEWDFAELENGDLLAVLRVAVFEPSGKLLRQERRQCLLVKQGRAWRPGSVAVAPFPHSGHPELLMTREGVLLHIAANGIWGTIDRGATWKKLNSSGTAYYPNAVQLKNGVILVVSHVGSDDPYGKIDQSIVLDAFRIAVKR